MKQLIIGAAVLGVFIAYSLGIRHEQPKVPKPAALGRQANSSSASAQTPPSSATTPRKDGTFTGSVADAYYGNVQVQVIIQGGKITDVKFLDYPHTHETSVYINQQAMPYLQQEAIKSQSADVNVVTGATFTSQAFRQSLAAALAQA